MKKSSKLLTLVAAVALFVALGTGVALAYGSGYHSGAAATPESAAALVAPSAPPVNAAVLFTPATTGCHGQSQASNATTTTRVIPAAAGSGLLLGCDQLVLVCADRGHKRPD